MNAPLPSDRFFSFATRVTAVLEQANVPLATGDNYNTPGTRAEVQSGYSHDPQNLCALVYCEKVDAGKSMSWAPLEYKTILERAGYRVQAGRVPGGWDVWLVYPPA